MICTHLWPSNKSLSVWLLAVTDMGAGKIWSQAIPYAPNLTESSLFSCYWDVIYKYHHLLLQLLWQTLTVYLHCLHWSWHRVLHVTVIFDIQLKPLTGVKKNCNPEPQSLQAATFFTILYSRCKGIPSMSAFKCVLKVYSVISASNIVGGLRLRNLILSLSVWFQLESMLTVRQCTVWLLHCN